MYIYIYVCVVCVCVHGMRGLRGRQDYQLAFSGIVQSGPRRAGFKMFL